MSFACWNPALRTQSTLFNAQTAKLEDVRMEALAGTSIEVHDIPLLRHRPSLSAGRPGRSTSGIRPKPQWIGLDSIVGGSRKLSYRLP